EHLCHGPCLCAEHSPAFHTCGCCLCRTCASDGRGNRADDCGKKCLVEHPAFPDDGRCGITDGPRCRTNSAAFLQVRREFTNLSANMGSRPHGVPTFCFHPN